MLRRFKQSTILFISVWIIFAIISGMTFAWFGDFNRAEARFSAGVLDVELTPGREGDALNQLTFVNLRPMTVEGFDQELNQYDFSNVNQEGFDPVPCYFCPVTLRNLGSLPMQVELSACDNGPCEEQVPNMVENGHGGVVQDGTVACADAYALKQVLKLFLYEQNADGTWNPVVDEQGERVNLNTASGGKAYRPYTAEHPLPAQQEKAYLAAAYLPETVGNEYQGQHCHLSLTASACQIDMSFPAGSRPEDHFTDGPGGASSQGGASSEEGSSSGSSEGTEFAYVLHHYLYDTKTSIKVDETGTAPAGNLEYLPDSTPVWVNEKEYVPMYDRYSFEVKENDANEFTVFYREVLQSGDGSSWDKAILITTPEELNRVRNALDKYYKLANDIDLSGYANWSPIGGVLWASGWFKGGLDGNGYKITNLTIHRTADRNQPYTGLFGTVYDSTGKGEVKLRNIVIDNGNVTVTNNDSNYHAGLLVGFCYGAAVENCHTSGTLASKSPGTGGVVGATLSTSYSSYDKGFITRCSSCATITSGGTTGGVVGNVNIPVSQCYFNGSITSDSGAIGGIAGASKTGAVSNCWSSGSIQGAHGSNGVGGIVGNALAAVNNCYTVATINTTNNVNPATAVGRTAQPALGNRTGMATSVLFQKGNFQVKGVSSSIWDTYTGGYLNGTGKTEQELRTTSAYGDFDKAIWSCKEGEYPDLVNNPRN